MASLRLGVVLGFDGDLRSEIDGLRRAIDSPQLSIVEPHITLSSPTNVESRELIFRLVSLFRFASRQSSFDARIGPSSSFRVDKFVSLLSVTSDCDLEKLSLSVRDLMGLGDPQYPFVPHVTLFDGASQQIVDSTDFLFSGYKRRASFDSLIIFRMNKKGAYAKFAEPIFTSEFRSSAGGRVVKYFLLRGVGDLLSYLFEDEFYSSHVGEYGSHLAIDTPISQSFSVVGFDDEDRPISFATLRQLGAVVTLERVFLSSDLRGLGMSRGVLSAVAYFLVARGARFLDVPIVDCDERLEAIFKSLGAVSLVRGGDPYSDRYSLNLLNL